MIYSTTETIPGRDIIESVGVVTGNVVQAKHIGRDIMAGLKSIVGGEIRGYTEMLNEARDIAIGRLVESANQKGADAVIGDTLHYELYYGWFLRDFSVRHRGETQIIVCR